MEKFTIKALAAYKGMTLAELATAAHIGAQRLRDIARGKSRMYAFELYALSEATGVPAELIVFDY